MSEALPDNWTTATINEITIDVEQREPGPKEVFQYIDIGSIDRERKLIAWAAQVVGAQAPSRARKVVHAGDVLVSMTRPNLNAVALVPPEFDGEIASTGFDVLRAVEVEPRWLYYLVRTETFVTKMSDLVQGALYPAVRSKDVRGFPVPLAPLNEQKRIADKLDSILAKVDACRERLAGVPDILKRFRQAVLAAACSGQLAQGNRDHWERTVLKEVCRRDRIITYGVIKLGNDYPEGVPCLRTSDVRWLRINTKNTKRISPAISKEYSRTVLQGGEVLVNVRGTLGGVAVATFEMAGWNVSREIAVVPVNAS